MSLCAPRYEFAVDRTAKFSVLRNVQRNRCPSATFRSDCSNITDSSISYGHSNIFSDCSARTVLIELESEDSESTSNRRKSENGLDMGIVEERNTGCRSLSSIDFCNLFVSKMLSSQGCCILGKFFLFSSLQTVKLAFKPLVKKLKMLYDEVTDEFDGE